ncbi:unnamed protein product [Orchesella dallaii]|uniref:Uncharacterized protein n=1 Tax=Orchesella dallaii TaxID=48710 RepID=A0ABP1S000_9HEXA
MYQVDINQLARLYSPQSGRGLDDLQFYKSSYRRQRGNGLGGIFGSIAKRLIPFAKNILWPAAKKYVLPHAQEAVKNIAGDIISGRNVKESIKERGSSAIKGIGDQIMTQSGSGRSRKRKRLVKLTSYKKRKISKKRQLSPLFG